MRLSDMKIGQRLGLGFSLILILLTFIALIALFSPLQARRQLTQTISDTNTKFTFVAAMQQSLLRQGVFSRRIGVTVEFDDMKKNMAEVIAEKRKYDTFEAQFTHQKLSDEERNIITEMEPYKKATWYYQQQADELVTSFNGGQAAKILATQAAPIQERWLDAIDRLIAIQNEHIQKNLSQFNTASDRTNQAIILTGTLTILLAAAIALYLTNSITTPLSQAIDLSKRVAGGDLDVHILPSTQDETGELLASLSEMTLKLKEARDTLDSLAHQDGLTSLANRRCFDKTLDNEWRRIMRQTHNLSFVLNNTSKAEDVISRELALSLLMIDVDYFKHYNDRYGHQAGDECLKKVAATISSVLKRPSDLVARYGGEEFAVILSNVPKDGATIVAERIRAAVEQLELPSGNPATRYVTISVGVASITPVSPEENPEKLLATADAALYEAKHSGRNQVVIFNYNEHTDHHSILSSE